MKFWLIVFAVLNTSLTFAQEENDYVLYLDSLEQLVSQENYDFIRVLKNFYGDTPDCMVIDYYKSGQRKMFGSYADKYNFYKSGPFTSYYENGKMQSQINFAANEPIGKSYFWYENGSKKAECEFIASKNEEAPLMKVNQYWSRIAIHRVIDGKGHFQDEDVTSFSEGELLDGFKEGQWWGTDYKDAFTFTETYKKGKLISGIATDSIGETHAYHKIYIPPRPLKSQDDFYNHFDKKMKQMQGNKPNCNYATVMVGFWVDLQGKPRNITVLHEIAAETKRKIISSIASYGLWLPAESRGIATEVSMMIPVYVQLD